MLAIISFGLASSFFFAGQPLVGLCWTIAGAVATVGMCADEWVKGRAAR